jgi:hypothetical protein
VTGALPRLIISDPDIWRAMLPLPIINIELFTQRGIFLPTTSSGPVLLVTCVLTPTELSKIDTDPVLRLATRLLRIWLPAQVCGVFRADLITVRRETNRCRVTSTLM